MSTLPNLYIMGNLDQINCLFQLSAAKCHVPSIMKAVVNRWDTTAKLMMSHFHKKGRHLENWISETSSELFKDTNKVWNKKLEYSLIHFLVLFCCYSIQVHFDSKVSLTAQRSILNVSSLCFAGHDVGKN